MKNFLAAFALAAAWGVASAQTYDTSSSFGGLTAYEVCTDTNVPCDFGPVVDQFGISPIVNYTQGLTYYSVYGQNGATPGSGRDPVPGNAYTTIATPTMNQTAPIVLMTVINCPDGSGNLCYTDGTYVQYDPNTGNPYLESTATDVVSCGFVYNADGSYGYQGCATDVNGLSIPEVQAVGPAIDLIGGQPVVWLPVVAIAHYTNGNHPYTIWRLGHTNADGTTGFGAQLADGGYDIEFSGTACSGRASAGHPCGISGGTHIYVSGSTQYTYSGPPPCGNECGDSVHLNGRRN